MSSCGKRGSRSPAQKATAQAANAGKHSRDWKQDQTSYFRPAAMTTTRFDSNISSAKVALRNGWWIASTDWRAGDGGRANDSDQKDEGRRERQGVDHAADPRIAIDISSEAGFAGDVGVPEGGVQEEADRKMCCVFEELAGGPALSVQVINRLPALPCSRLLALEGGIDVQIGNQRIAEPHHIINIFKTTDDAPDEAEAGQCER